MASGKEKKDTSKHALAREVQESLVKETLAAVSDAVKEAFDRRRPFLIAAVAQKISKSGPLPSDTPTGQAEQWTDIESLSRLRGIVGGRFQNLRDRWTAAGFPLKEHRGERNEPVEVNQEGWIELSNWIMKQGFEARLVPGKEDCLFQLRKTG